MGNLSEKRWVFLIFFSCIILISVFTNAQECCPVNSYVIENSKTCSDNVSFYSLKCEHGIMLLDPSINEFDNFSLDSSGSLSFFNGEKRIESEFCLGKLQRKENENPKSVALVCFHDEWSQPYISVTLRVLMLISILFLALTLYIYLVLPNLKDLQGKCLIAFICCLISSYVTLLVIQTFPNSSQKACVIQAASLYFFMTAIFFWNNIITFNIWIAIRNGSVQISKKTCVALYAAWGFGVPLGMVLLSLILEHIPNGNHIRPQFGEARCWFRGKLESWVYFYGPISILLLLNIAMFLQSSWKLWKIYKASNHLKFKSLKFKYMMYLKLFLLMGIPWTFEVISYATDEFESTKFLWFVTDCLNSAQGILIFLILVVFRQKVRLGLLKEKLLNISWPQSWAKEEVQESSILSDKEEVELANQKSNLLN